MKTDQELVDSGFIVEFVLLGLLRINPQEAIDEFISWAGLVSQADSAEDFDNLTRSSLELVKKLSIRPPISRKAEDLSDELKNALSAARQSTLYGKLVALVDTYGPATIKAQTKEILDSIVQDLNDAGFKAKVVEIEKGKYSDDEIDQEIDEFFHGVSEQIRNILDEVSPTCGQNPCCGQPNSCFADTPDYCSVLAGTDFIKVFHESKEYISFQVSHLSTYFVQEDELVITIGDIPHYLKSTNARSFKASLEEAIQLCYE